MRMKGHGWLIIGVLFASIVLVINSQGVNGDVHNDDRVLIIISGYEGYSDDGMEKANAFYEYLIDEGYTNDQIIFLGDINYEHVDNNADIDNIDSAFQSLEGNCSFNSDVIIYIYDHEKLIENNATFLFEDGNLTATYIDSKIDNINFGTLNMFLTGERSSLSGPILQDYSRDIFCSMGDDQEFSPDNLNITRSLIDPNSDLNSDGEITFNEAYLHEVEILQNYGQYPEKW